MRSSSVTPTPQKVARKFELSVKSELLSRRMTVKALAQEMGFSRAAVSRAINRHESAEMVRRIKETLELA